MVSWEFKIFLEQLFFKLGNLSMNILVLEDIHKVLLGKTYIINFVFVNAWN